MTNDNNHIRLGRRAFLHDGTLILAAASVSSGGLCAKDDISPLRVGLVTDLHYADKAPAGTRHYRESLAKLEEAANQFNQDQPTFLVELGDLIDAADSVEVEQTYLRTINQKFAAICNDRHYVLGNPAFAAMASHMAETILTGPTPTSQRLNLNGCRTTCMPPRKKWSSLPISGWMSATTTA